MKLTQAQYEELFYEANRYAAEHAPDAEVVKAIGVGIVVNDYLVESLDDVKDALQGTTLADRVLDILSRTHDGNDLCKRDLKLCEMAVNDMLSEEGRLWLLRLHRAVLAGYTPDWMTELKPDATTACNP